MRSRQEAASVLAIAGALLAVGAAWRPGPDAPTVCPLRLLTGIPCPTCGLGRAVCATLHGDLAAAVAAHPFGPAVVAAACVAVAASLADVRDGGERLVRLGRFARAGALLALALTTLLWWPGVLRAALAHGWGPLLAEGVLTGGLVRLWG